LKLLLLIDFFNLQPDNQEKDKTAKLQTVKLVNRFAAKDESNNSEEDKKIEEKEISKQETVLVKYTTYLPEELITKVKIQAALQRKK
jgi:flagella basal body P-ring formation protein FlgA